MRKIPRKRLLLLLALAAALSWALVGGAAPTSASWIDAPVSTWQPEPAPALSHFIALSQKLAGPAAGSTDYSVWAPPLSAIGSAAYAPPQDQPGSISHPEWEPVTDLISARAAGELKRALATGNTWSDVSACQGAVTFPCPKTLVICAGSLSCNLSASPGSGAPQDASSRQGLKTALGNFMNNVSSSSQSGDWFPFEEASTAQASPVQTVGDSGPHPALKASEGISELVSSAAAQHSASSAAAQYSGGLSPN